MRIFELDQLRRQARGSRIVDGTLVLSKLRIVKDDGEAASLRRAAQVLIDSLIETWQSIRPGNSEREIAARWQAAMRAHGADRIPDEPIVAGGPNSENPHTSATDRPLQPGDFIIFDGWCQVDGYFADITRTV